jgi:organic hydroperoxide reductase OsmC/OhrA
MALRLLPHDERRQQGAEERQDNSAKVLVIQDEAPDSLFHGTRSSCFQMASGITTSHKGYQAWEI